VKGRCVVNVHTSYIAQVKWMCGQDMGENYNKSKKDEIAKVYAVLREEWNYREILYEQRVVATE